MRLLSIDPGETVGWSLWEDRKLIEAGQSPMWEFADELYDGMVGDPGRRDAGWPESRFVGIDKIVCEDFKLYPWELDNLEWDEVLTARLIGAIQLVTRITSTPLVLQGAQIKEAAERAGAEHLFVEPLHPNRHANDAIRHAVFYYAKNEHARVA